MTSKKTIYIIIAAIAAGAVALVFWQAFSWRQANRTKSVPDLPLNSCSAEQFVQRIKPGGEAAFRVRLETSRFLRPYSVRLGDLPGGVTGAVEGGEGRGNGEVTVVLRADISAAPADYSLVIIYEEDPNLPTALVSYCQYNLIVESNNK